VQGDFRSCFLQEQLLLFKDGGVLQRWQWPHAAGGLGQLAACLGVLLFLV